MNTNAGLEWTVEEEERLELEARLKHLTLKELSAKFGRSPAAIVGRLETLANLQRRFRAACAILNDADKPKE